MLKNKKLNLKSTCHCEEPMATRQSHEIASHSFAMTETTSCHASLDGASHHIPAFVGMTESGRSSSSLSFPCLTRESTWCGPNAPHFTRFAQSGRSMVEMLGVLAVIGVLSVAGIAGYTTAMNKHRANELLNEASKRAVVVVPQIAMGNTPSIGEFTNPSDHNFELKGPDGTSAWKDTDKQFAITISGVSKEICQQMKNASGGVIKGFKPDTCADNATVKLTFNNDMSTADVASEGSGSIDTGTCANGNIWLSYAEAGHECDTTTPSNMGCKKNSDCASTEKCQAGAGKCYCKLTGTSQNNCSVITAATCETLDAGTETTYENGSDKKTFLVSSGTMTWWAAENWCKAHHKSLVSYSTLNSLFDCDNDEANYYDNPSCTWSKFNTSSNWSNGAPSANYWTAESVAYNSCIAWVVYVGGNAFGDGSRKNNFSVLCE